MNTKFQRISSMMVAIVAGLVFALGVGWVFSQAAASSISLLDVVVSEVAWSGRSGATADEWIELFNNTETDINLTGWRLYTGDGSPDMPLNGVIPAGGHYLMERTNDTTVPSRTMDFQYTGALTNYPGEVITLTNDTGQVIDVVGLDSNDDWFAGSASPNYYTMERVNLTAAGTLESSWGDGGSLIDSGKDSCYS